MFKGALFEKLSESLAESFDQHWLIHIFGPALIFWGAGLWVWAKIKGLDTLLADWSTYSDEKKLLYGGGALLVVLLSALLLEAFAGALLRLAEGYGWPRRAHFAQRRAADLRRKRERRRVLRTKVATTQVTPEERVERARLETELAHRPQEPERSMPTRLGDVLRAAEDYPRQRYGLDPITFWPRLYPHLPDPLRGALRSTRDQLDLLLRLAALSAVYGLVWSAVLIAHGEWGRLLWTLPALLLVWVLIRAAESAAIAYADLFRSAFDLHRLDVYASLQWPPPDSPVTESTHGRRLVLYLQSGQGAEDITYAQTSGDS